MKSRHIPVASLFLMSSLMAGGLALLAGCQKPAASAPPPQAVGVKAAVPLIKQIVEWDEFTGRLEPLEFVEVRARVGGYLDSIHFAEGQLVKQGDLLCVIDQRPYTALVKQAKATLNEAHAKELQAKSEQVRMLAEKTEAKARLLLAQQQIQRTENLIANNVATREDLDIRKSELQQAAAGIESADANLAAAEAAIAGAVASIGIAEAALEAAELNLEYTEILAPISGRVSRRLVTEGNLVSGGTDGAALLTTIVSLDPIHCYFDADETAFLKYQRLAESGKRTSSREAKNPIYLALADEHPKFPHRGYMDFVDNRLDANTGTMRARAILRNSDLALTPGLFARLRLPASRPYDAILIPDRAISNDQSAKFVYVVDPDGKVRRQNIKTGARAYGLRVVTDGLKGTEQIVTQGLQRVRPGVTVKVDLETVEPLEDDGLPNDYQPVPESEWIPRKPAAPLRPRERREEAPAATPEASEAPPATPETTPPAAPAASKAPSR